MLMYLWSTGWVLNNIITKTGLFKYIESFITKNWKFSDKNYDIFHISAQNIDCGYSLEPRRRGGSDEYPDSMFLSRNMKDNVYLCKPQFYYINVGFKGVKIILVCFRDETLIGRYVLRRLIKVYIVCSGLSVLILSIISVSIYFLSNQTPIKVHTSLIGCTLCNSTKESSYIRVSNHLFVLLIAENCISLAFRVYIWLARWENGPFWVCE